MNMWEEAYFRHKEYKRVSINPQTDIRLSCPQKPMGWPDSHNHQVTPVSFKSFEEVYYQIKRPQPASPEPPNSSHYAADPVR